MRLTAKQERFAQRVAGGATYSDAWRDVYKPGAPAVPTTWVSASQVASNPKVALRVNELNDQAAVAAGADIVWAMSRLKAAADQLAESDPAKVATPIRLMAELCGWFPAKERDDDRAKSALHALEKLAGELGPDELRALLAQPAMLDGDTSSP